MKYVRFDYDSNVRYLPLVYFLPTDQLAKFPTLRRLPRKVREVLYVDTMMDVVNSDQFLNEIMDAWAALVFPHLGFRGWKEHYTGDFPAWKLTYALPPYCEALEEEIGWNLQALLNIHSSQDIPFFEPEFIKATMKTVVWRVIDDEGWQPMLDALREMPCEEDFEKRPTNVRKDFLRKWYHTRSKRVKMVSLEACMEDEDHAVHEVADPTAEFEQHIIAEDVCQQFKEHLSQRDWEILELRIRGLTYERIAELLGYKNHSGVLKRIRAIEKKFLDFEEKHRQ